MCHSIASIIQPQSTGLSNVIKLEPNSGSYYCNTYSPTDDPNGPLALNIPVNSTGTVLNSTGHNSQQSISHSISNSNPNNNNGQHNKRQRRLTSAEDPEKSPSDDLQYYAHPWSTHDLDQLPAHMHMSPHVKVKQEVLHVGHYHCSQSPKELSTKSLTESHNRESERTLLFSHIF